LHPDLAGRNPDHHALLGCHQQLVLIGDGCGAADEALPGVDVLDAHAAPSLQRVLAHLRPLAVAPICDGEQCVSCPHPDHIHAYQLVSRAQADGLDPHCAAIGGPHLLLLEANGLAELCGDEQLPAAVSELCRDQAVALQVHCLDAALSGIGECLQWHLDYAAAARDQDDESRVKAFDWNGAGDPLVWLQLQQVDNGLATRRPAQGWDLVDLQPVGLALVREEEQVVPGGGGEDICHELLALRLGSYYPLAAPPLAAICGERLPLDVAGGGDGHSHILLLNQVLVGDLAVGLNDGGPPLVTVIFSQLRQLLLDDGQNLLVA